jgi:hypothetical protein
MENINEYILAEAKKNNICNEWALKIVESQDADELMKMYCAGIDFCLTNNFPSNADLKRLVGDIMNGYGVYVDQQFKLQDRPFIVALANTIGDVKCSGYSVTHLFAKHQSHIRVVAGDNAFLVIDCFDHSFVDVKAGGSAKVLINVYGKATVAHVSFGNAIIKIVQKLKDTY